MSRLLESMAVRLVGDGTSYNAMITTAIERTNQFVANFSAKMMQVGVSMTMLTGRMNSFGKEITKMGMSFDLEMSRIRGLVGASQLQMEQYKRAIIEMGPSLAKSPQELASALYYITSAGFEGAEALDVLKQSAMAATAGLGQTQTVADFATTVVTAYGKGNVDASKAVDVLTAAVRVGKAEATSMADALGRIVPIAAAMGVSIDEVSGAIAVMSKAGLDAFEATTALRGLLATLQKPSNESQEVLRMVGLSVGELRDIIKKPGGTVEALRMLRERFGEAVDLMSAVIPNVRAVTGAWNLLSQKAEDVDEAMRQVRESAGDMKKAFDVAIVTPAMQAERATQEFKSQMTLLGGTVSETVIPILLRLGQTLGDIYRWVNDLHPIVKILGTALGFLAVSVGPVLITFGLLIPLIAGGVTQMIAFASAVKVMSVALFTTPWTLALVATTALAVSLVKLSGAWTGATERIEAFNKSMGGFNKNTSKMVDDQSEKTTKIMEGIAEIEDPDKRRKAIAAEMKKTAEEMKRARATRDVFSEGTDREGGFLNTMMAGAERTGIIGPGLESRRVLSAEAAVKRQENLMESLQERAKKLKNQWDILHKARKPDTDIFASDVMRMTAALRDQADQVGRTSDEFKLFLMVRQGLDADRETKLLGEIDAVKMRQLSHEIGEATLALIDQHKTFDMTATSAAAYKFAVQGASESDIKSFRRMSAMVEAQKTERQFETPTQALARRMEELNEQFLEGDLSVSAYTRAVMEARKAIQGLSNAVNAMDLKSADFLALLIEQGRTDLQQVTLPKKGKFIPGLGPDGDPMAPDIDLKRFQELANQTAGRFQNTHFGPGRAGAMSAGIQGINLGPADVTGGGTGGVGVGVQVTAMAETEKEQAITLKEILTELRKQGKTPSVNVIGIDLFGA